METNLIAKSKIEINSPAHKVWVAITTADSVQKFMMGMKPISTWTAGSELRWIGRHEEKPNDNARGIINVMDEDKKLEFTFYYPGYGYPDEPEYYNTVTFILAASGQKTIVEAAQGNFSVFKEGAVFAEHSQKFWDSALQTLKEICEAAE